MPHDEAALVRKGDKLVVLAPVDLHLVLVEKMPGTLGDDIERRIEAFGVVDRERRVGEMLGLCLRYGRRDPLGGEPAPDRRQFLHDGAIAIALRGHAGGHTPEAVGAGEKAVEIVEASILRVDHHHCLDLFESGGTLGFHMPGRGMARCGTPGHRMPGRGMLGCRPAGTRVPGSRFS
jgi:hypothetical protein